jgi:predicted HTH transcriptional regulator
VNTPIVPLTDAELLSRLANLEDSFVERKTCGDSKDWLKTVVGFANSTPIGYPAILYIGIKDNGMPEAGVSLEKLQQTFTNKMQAAYPVIYFTTRILAKNGSQFLAVIVPGSEDRPHFAGPSYVRKGNRTELASEPQFDELLADRLSKSRYILKYINKAITVDRMNVARLDILDAVANTAEQIVVFCNTQYVTLANKIGWPGESIPLRRVEISRDNHKDRLKLEIYPI